MLTDRIIGRVGAEILAKRISNPGQPGESTALFRLDKLSSSQIAAVARAIQATGDLLARVDIMIPEALVDGQDLPSEMLIAHNAGYVRNKKCTGFQIFSAQQIGGLSQAEKAYLWKTRK